MALIGSRGIPARFGGLERHVEDVSYVLCEHGYDVYVACEKPMENVHFRHPGIVRVFFPLPERLRSVFTLLYDAVAVTWATLKGPDLIYVSAYVIGPFVIIPKIFRRRVLINVDGMEWQRTSYPRLVRIVLRIFEGVVARSNVHILCDSLAIQEYYKRRYSVRSSTYVPYFVETLPRATNEDSIHRRWGLTTDEYYLSICRLESENNIELIVSEFVKSRSKKKLLLVGPTSGRSQLDRILSIKSDSVILTGPIYEREVLASLRYNAFAYIHGHEVGGTNPSLLEAMSCGDAILALDVPFNREVLRSSGLFFGKNTGDLSEKIHVLESSPSLVNSLRSGSKVVLERYYSKKTICDNFLLLVRAIVS